MCTLHGESERDIGCSVFDDELGELGEYVDKMFGEHASATADFENADDLFACVAEGGEDGVEEGRASFAGGDDAVFGTIEVLHDVDVGVEGLDGCLDAIL